MFGRGGECVVCNTADIFAFENEKNDLQKPLIILVLFMQEH